MPLEDALDHSNVGREMYIVNVAFGDGIVEINYFEERDQGEDVALMKNLVVKKSLFMDQVSSVIEELEEIVDGGLLHLRNPDKSFDPRERLAKAARNDEGA